MGKRLLFALAGLQTGITGALAMLFSLSVSSAWTRHSPWWIPNLVASAFYGTASLRNGVGIYTAVGAAMVLVFCGLAGLVFGEVVGSREGGFRLVCFALIFALAIHWAEQRWFWTASNPLGYAPTGQILFAHLVFGFFLAGYPKALRGIWRQVGVIS